jgi:DNA-binding PadR family transcriptional regulator
LNNTTTGAKQKMNINNKKETQTKLTKGLLDMIILQYLENESMHGYQLITKIRKGFGVNFGPSTVYPLLGLLEKKGYVKSAWNMDSDRPRKMYTLTNDGKDVLSFTENSLNMICKNMVNNNKIQLQVAPQLSTRMKILA